MHGIETKIVEFLTTPIQGIGWPGVAVIMALESANIPIPSEVIMPLAGWMLVQAPGMSAWQAVWLGGLFGAIGCTIGAALSYWLEVWGGRPLIKRCGGWITVSEEELENANIGYKQSAVRPSSPRPPDPLNGLHRTFRPAAPSGRRCMVR